jgi:hypothetical protein
MSAPRAFVDGQLLDDTAPRRTPRCACLDRLATELKPHNGVPGKAHRSGAAFVYVRRLDPGGALPPGVIASFCPFCGEAYG